MKFRQHTLDNGLEIIAETNPNAYSLGVGFFVKTGARDESPEEAGVSHFLEHMLFKGSPNRSAADLNRELDEIGSHANAYTSEERTVYYATILPEYQSRAVDLLADMMRPALREEDFTTEKNVIIEEICKYEDQPPFGAHEKAMAAYFAPHPLGNNILGSVESVTNLSVDTMRRYFEERYSPSNITLVAAGNVDFEGLVAQAQRMCGEWAPALTSRKTTAASPRTSFEVIKKEMATQEYVVQISPGPTAEDDDRYAMRVLATVVGDDSGSRLYWDLIETGLAEYAAVWPYEFHQAGITMSFMSCMPEDAAENLQRMQDVLRQVEAEGITQDELEQALAKICSSMVLRSERASSRLFTVGGGWLQRREYRSLKESIDRFRAVTIDDVARVLAKYPLSQNTTICVGPLDDIKPPA